MIARGLVLNSSGVPIVNVNGMVGEGDNGQIQQWTNSLPGKLERPYGSEETDSNLSINTPSTGQGFSHSESMDSISDGQNTYPIPHAQLQTQPQTQTQGGQAQGQLQQSNQPTYVLGPVPTTMDMDTGAGDGWGKEDHPGMIGHMDMRPPSQQSISHSHHSQGGSVQGHSRNTSTSSLLGHGGHSAHSGPVYPPPFATSYPQDQGRGQYTVEGGDAMAGREGGMYGMNVPIYYTQPHPHPHAQSQPQGQGHGQMGMGVDGAVFGYPYYHPGSQGQVPGQPQGQGLGQGQGQGQGQG